VYIKVVGWLFDYVNNLQLQLLEFFLKIQRTSGSGFFGIRKNFGFGPLENLETKNLRFWFLWKPSIVFFEIYGYVPTNK
jgi:hypothetical protein